MSRRNIKQFADTRGAVHEITGLGTDRIVRNAAPTAGEANCIKGCIYADRLNGHVYENVGTVTSAVWFQLDGLALGSLARAEINTAITTAGAGTLTAAAIAGGVITRTGPTAIYTDTTDTAALIIAALPTGTPVGASWEMTILNTVAFPQTLAGGTGVTLSGNTIIPPNSSGQFLVTYATASTVTIRGLNGVPLTTMPLMVRTNLTTAGAGTITAAGIAGGVTNRTGATVAYTDTTDTAANIIAALPNANIGQSFVYTYYNNTLGNATITGGSGVTVTGTLVPQTCWAEFLVTFTAAATVTMVQIAAGPNVSLQAASFVLGTASTLNAGDASGAHTVHYENNASNATVTLRTATQMFGDIPNCQIGFTYTLFIRNLNATGMTLAAPDGNTTLSGTMTIAQNVTRMFHVRFASATTMTVTSMGIFAAGA